MPVQLAEISQLSEPGSAAIMPEFLDVDQVRIYFGIKQSLLYRLLAERKIRAVSIRQRGKTRGRRLFDVASIRAFLNAQVDVDPEFDGDQKEVAL
jgi:hypothetical protein